MANVSVGLSVARGCRARHVLRQLPRRLGRRLRCYLHRSTRVFYFVHSPSVCMSLDDFFVLKIISKIC
jgi:hypothetical protein